MEMDTPLLLLDVTRNYYTGSGAGDMVERDKGGTNLELCNAHCVVLCQRMRLDHKRDRDIKETAMSSTSESHEILDR